MTCVGPFLYVLLLFLAVATREQLHQDEASNFSQMNTLRIDALFSLLSAADKVHNHDYLHIFSSEKTLCIQSILEE
jgi:hypothetical protein